MGPAEGARGPRGRSEHGGCCYPPQGHLSGNNASRRANADKCADYLLARAPYLDYPAALASGWPIATGVVEGAYRHIVADRMNLTGARWGLEGAAAVLKLRALRSNGDFSTYWGFHLARERQRVHEAHYANGALPRAA